METRLEALLVRRCLDTLSLARRAGQAVCGFEKVRAALKEGGVAVLVQASDGGDDGRSKLVAVARAVAPRLPVVELFDAAQQGVPFGRDQAVHVALAPGGLAQRFCRDAVRLAGFRCSGIRLVEAIQSPASTV